MSRFLKTIVKSNETMSGNARSFEKGRRHKKSIGWILVFALALFDFFTVYISFAGTAHQLAWYELAACCLVIVLCLDGLPAYLGIVSRMISDKKKIDINDKGGAVWWVFFVSLIGTVFVFCLVTIPRLTISMIGKSEFERNLEMFTNNEERISVLQRILVLLPIATSGLAFVISWGTLGEDRLEQQGYKVDWHYEKYEQCRREFQEALGGLRNARAAIWTALDATSKAPKKLHVFYKEIYAKAHSKIIEDSLAMYPLQLTRFNSAVRGELDVFIGELCAKSTVPYAISNINIDDILEEFDELQMAKDRNEDIWNHNKSLDMLETELRRILDNAVIVAQTRTYSYFPLEEEREC